MNEPEEVIERRQFNRVKLENPPIRVGYKDPNSDETFIAEACGITVSESGLELSSASPLPLLDSIVLKVRLEPADKELQIRGKIIWRNLSTRAGKDYCFYYGVEFLALSSPVQEQLNQFISRNLLPDETQLLRLEKSADSQIVSQLIRYQNRSGRTIVGIYDHIPGDTDNKPFIVIPPAYGEAKQENLYIAYYLVKNGFNVLRYDNTDHIGESDGEILNTTLSQMKEDLFSTINYLEKNLWVKEIGVVGISLIGRVAIKATSEDSRIKFLLLLAAVVDLQNTLFSVYGRDLIHGKTKGKKWGELDIIGFDIDADNFLENAIEGNYATAKTTQKDLEKIKCPVAFLFAERDPWVSLTTVKNLLENSQSKYKEIKIIPSMHQFKENPEIVRQVIKQIVVYNLKYLSNKRTNINEIKEPSREEIFKQTNLERERMKKSISFTSQDEKKFWSNYLDKFNFIINIPDYWELLTYCGQSLGVPRQNEIVLDVGCGNGSFGVWQLMDLVNRFTGHKKIEKFSYVGLDFEQTALARAMENVGKVKEQLKKDYNLDEDIVNCSYIFGDLNSYLPFLDNYFDKICCNLVISYLRKPIKTISELFRILKPGGKIVISSLKPNADLSQIYRNYIWQAKSQSEIDEGYKLLTSAGTIKEKESQGQFKFFSGKELLNLVSKAGGKKAVNYKTFAGQANLVVAYK